MNNDGTCPIWRTDATFEPKKGDYERVNSPRVGGQYFISGTARAILPNSDSVKARLTTWLIDQRELGNEWPEINSDTIEQFKQRQPLPVNERADRLLKYLAKKSTTIGAPVESKLTDRAEVVMEMKAWSESLSVKELIYLGEYLAEQGWVNKFRNDSGHIMTTITVKGYARLAELATKQINSSQGFVAMWFDDSMTEAYEKGIGPGIQDAGYEPLRIDKKEHANKIDDEIIAEIRRSRFVVADFTYGDTGHRGGVYYEAGFAHGLNIPVFFTCRKDLIDLIHFDTRQYNHIKWTDYTDLRKQLADRISAVIGDGPDKPPKEG